MQSVTKIAIGATTWKFKKFWSHTGIKNHGQEEHKKKKKWL